MNKGARPGSRRGYDNLSERQQRTLLKLYEGDYPMTVLVARFGISKQNIHNFAGKNGVQRPVNRSVSAVNGNFYHDLGVA